MLHPITKDLKSLQGESETGKLGKKFDLKNVLHPITKDLKRLQGELETGKLGKKFDLKKSGSADGTQNNPSPDSILMSPTEIELHAHVNQTVSSAYGKVTEGLLAIQTDLDNLKSDLNVDQDIESIKNSSDHLGPRVLVETASHKAAILRSAEHYGNLVRSFKKFQSDNGLQAKVPRYPADAIKHLRWLFGGAILEFVLAYPFYFEVASNKVTAFGFALLVVILNIILAFISGFLFVYINHVSPAKKWGHALLSAFCFGLFVAAILLAGHLRTAIAAVVSGSAGAGLDNIDLMAQAGTAAFGTFILSPFSLGGDVLPIMFLLASFGFGLFTAWKAYTIDDEYPGFGALDRQKLSAEKQLTADRNSLFTALNKVFDDASLHTKEVFNQARSRCTDIVHSVDQYQNLYNEYPRFYEQANINLNSALQIYRAANNFVRTVDPPAYFSDELAVFGLTPESMTPIQASDIELSRNLNLTVTSLSEILNETLRKIKESQKTLYVESESEISVAVNDAVKG